MKRSSHVLVILLSILVLSITHSGCGSSGNDTSSTDFALSVETLEIKTLVEGLSAPSGLGIDLDSVTFKDQIFVAEQGGSRLLAVAQDGTVTPMVTTNLSTPSDLLFDILPDSLFVTESQSNEISRVDFSQTPTVTTVIAALPQGIFPQAIATDGTARFVAARNTTKANLDQVYNISTNSPTLIAEGFTKVSGMTFRLRNDRSELLVTDSKAGTVVKLPLDNNDVQTNFDVLIDQLNTPTAIAIGPASEFIYICETGANLVVRTTADGKSLETVAKIATPSGLLFDNSGNLYVSSSDEGKVFKIVGLKESAQ
jgi:DNA-binding beta-propeller fold protein YncE